MLRLESLQRLAFLAFLTCTACARSGAGAGTTPDPERIQREEGAAMQLFRKNLRAIEQRNRDDYLSCYRPTDTLVRNGPEGVALGYAELAEGTPANGSDDWPERLDADQLEVHWVAPGVVYGSYRYVVTIDGETTTGRSERVFIREGERWYIAVTTAFQSPGPLPE